MGTVTVGSIVAGAAGGGGECQEDPASRYARPARCEISASRGVVATAASAREAEQPIKYTLGTTVMPVRPRRSSEARSMYARLTVFSSFFVCMSCVLTVSLLPLT